MTHCTNATATQAGILRPTEHARHVLTRRHACGEAAGYWIENYWSLAWDLPIGERFDAATLPHPACSLTLELGETRPEVGADPVVLTGVATRRFDVTVHGSGRVFGIKFRPGGLAALSGRSVAELRDRTVPAAGFAPEALVEAMRVLDPADPEAAAARVDHVVGSIRAGEPNGGDARYERVLRIVADMLADRSLLTVAQVEGRHHVSTRTLQRLFAHYVGVGPKWVLRRYRLHDLVSALDAGYAGSLADLAASLGWYDQAHVNRDFTALVGVSPGAYRSG